MSDRDRLRWDERYASRGAAAPDSIGLPEVFAPYADAFPAGGHALDLACGQGATAVWLARRGLTQAVGAATGAAGKLAQQAMNTAVRAGYTF